MSLHIGAGQGDIAETVLLSGDPLRAKYIAEHLLEDAQCYTSVRNMLGFTGYFEGHKLSIQGTGMGQPSLAIYLHELIHEYGATRFVRIGTCGALHRDIAIGDIILAQGACSDANTNNIMFNGLDFAPIANFDLLYHAYQAAQDQQLTFRVGNVFSTDLFYFKDDPSRWQTWVDHGVLCADMETSMLYTMAAGAGCAALSILTVSDNIILEQSSSAKDREQSYTDMVRIALAAVNAMA